MNVDIEENPSVEHTKIERIEASSLDQLITIFEISLIFLLTFTLITLIDTALSSFNIYEPISSLWLGVNDFGSLDGGNWEEIVRITLLFNGLLFAFSLGFGLWMRKTRDGWTWKQLGYTFRTENESRSEVFRKGVVLGIFVIFIYYLFISIAMFINSGGSFDALLSIHSFNQNGVNFTLKQLFAEFYFGIVEMGFIWPLSAGFFFFAYAHNSLRARFPIGVANVLSTLFYVFYLLFFFMIAVRGKLSVLPQMLGNPVLWANLFVFFIILYISFSAFATTRSIIIPFVLNFVFNVGLTIFKSFNSIFFSASDFLMLLPFLFTFVILIIWFFLKPSDLSTLKEGFTQLKDRKPMSYSKILQLFSIFFILAFLIPLIVEQIVFDYTQNLTTNALLLPIINLLFAGLFDLIILLSILVLTYKPTKVYDVLLMTKGGLPIASKINLFKSDKVLIAGFFSALASFNQELEKGKSDLKSIKRGEREIIIEDGVFTRLIALVDKDQPSLRNQILKVHRDFEIDLGVQINEWKGNEFPEAKPYVDAISKKFVTFNLSQETKWISILTLLLSPLMILLIGLI